jgi:hypothetical protein
MQWSFNGIYVLECELAFWIGAVRLRFTLGLENK